MQPSLLFVMVLVIYSVMVYDDVITFEVEKKPPRPREHW